MSEPVTADAVRYYGYWTPWLWLAAGWGIVVVMELAVIACALWRR